MRKFESGITYFGIASDPFVDSFSWPATVRQDLDGVVTLTLQIRSEEASSLWPDPWSRLDAAAPEFMTFAGDGISLACYGCTVLSASYGTRVDTVVARPEFAVADLKGFPLNGSAGSIRGEVTGLFNWIGTHSLESVLVHGDDGGLRKREVRTVHNEPIRFAENPSDRLELHCQWKTRDSPRPDHRGPSVLLSSVGWVQHEVFDRGYWREAFDKLESMRAMLTISSWASSRLLSTEVTFETFDEPFEDAKRRSWHRIYGRGLNQTAPDGSASSQHLYEWSDIGVSGLEKWQRLWRGRHSKRVIDNLLLIFEGGLTVGQRLLCAGSAVESMAHHLRLEDGKKPKQSSSEAYAKALLDHIAPVYDHPTPDEWCRKVSGNFNLTKHSDKTDYHPAPFEAFEVISEVAFYLRLSIGRLLGVEPDQLKTLSNYDAGNPSGQRYSISLDPAERFSQLIQENAQRTTE